MLFAQPMSAIISCDAVRDIGHIVPGFEMIQFVTIGISLYALWVNREIIAKRSYDGTRRSRRRTLRIITTWWLKFAN